MTKVLRAPFFYINCQEFNCEKELRQAAIMLDELAKAYKIDVVFVVKEIDVHLIRSAVQKLFLAVDYHWFRKTTEEGDQRLRTYQRAGVDGVLVTDSTSCTMLELTTLFEMISTLRLGSLVHCQSVQESHMYEAFRPTVKLDHTGMGMGKVLEPQSLRVQLAKDQQELTVGNMLRQFKNGDDGIDLTAVCRQGGSGAHLIEELMQAASDYKRVQSFLSECSWEL